ncbi:MAG: zeta toxin family protein [Pseudomonadota bacterium]
MAGPNGAGKTTFAKAFLPNEGQCVDYINADLIAAGLSPFAPERAQIRAGKLMLQRIQQCVAQARTFAFETTLSGRHYAQQVPQWQAVGYTVILYYFYLPSVEIAINRVAQRVRQGGHAIPEQVIRRRYTRSLHYLQQLYQPLVDQWNMFDTSSSQPVLMKH